jgi:predicted ATPase
MLEKVGFKNFLALRDVEIDLEPFTVIVGPNSSGKSTILDGIRRIAGAKHNLSGLIGTPDIANGLQSYDVNTYLNKKAQEVKLSFRFVEESSPEQFWEFSKERISSSMTSHKFYPKFEVHLLKFSVNDASKPSYSESLSPILEPSGQGLATICSYLQGSDPEKFLWIQEKIHLIIPGLKRFRIRPARVPALYWFNINLREKTERIARNLDAIGHEIIFDFENAENIPAWQVSEGTLFVLTVLAAASSSNENMVLLIDDLERGLHPKAVRDLMKALREIQKMTPGLQIIATSHSPYILDRLEAKEVRVATLDPELGTLVAKLEDYPDFEKWREAMTPGEFWSFVGEDWVRDLLVGKVRG